MQDRPNAVELLVAVREHLEAALLPAINDQRLRFQTLVAANVLSIVERELALSANHAEAEWARLDALLHDQVQLPATASDVRTKLAERNRELCAQIEAGAWDDAAERTALLAHVQQTATEKLEIANPRFLARAMAERPRNQ